MLASFLVKRTYYQLKAAIYVDVERKEAELSVSYAGRLKRNTTIQFSDVETPERAERFLTHPIGIHGCLLEELEHRFKHEEAA